MLGPCQRSAMEHKEADLRALCDFGRASAASAASAAVGMKDLLFGCIQQHLSGQRRQGVNEGRICKAGVGERGHVRNAVTF